MSINDQNNGTFNPYSSGGNGYTDTESPGMLLTKVFFAMFVSLLATGVLSYLIGSILERYIDAGNETALGILMFITFGSAIGLFVLSFVITKQMNNGFTSIMPAYITYLGLMAMLLSSVFIAYDMEVISLSFGVTAGVFGIMALMGYLSKGSLAGIPTLFMGVIIGAIGLSLVNFFLRSEMLAWIISFAVFAVILLITMYDVRKIKDMCNSGYMNENNNLVLYCSLILYLDFINIFLRVLRIIAIIARKK